MAYQCRRRGVGKLAAALAAACVTLAGDTASAQGIFDFLLGGGYRRSAPASPPVRAYGPSSDENSSRSGGSGRSAAYCVRLCDGRYFPIQRNSGADPAELCSAFCPATRTKVFSGSGIDHAVAQDGTRYKKLENAFRYRDQVIAGCTCNGKDSFGLARLNPKEDPTLRPGDVIATNDGLMAYTGDRSRSADFTPVQSSSGMSKEMQRMLSQSKVTPTPRSAKTPQTGSTVGQSSRDTSQANQTSR